MLHEKREGNIFYDIEDGSKKIITVGNMLYAGDVTIDGELFEACWDLETIHCIGNKGIVIPEEPIPAPTGNAAMSQPSSQETSEPALTREEAISRFKQNHAKTESEKLRENLDKLGIHIGKKKK